MCLLHAMTSKSPLLSVMSGSKQQGDGQVCRNQIVRPFEDVYLPQRQPNTDMELIHACCNGRARCSSTMVRTWTAASRSWATLRGARGKPGSGYGFGAGIRVDTPVGPLRIEYAYNDSGKRRFHLGIGSHG